MIVSQRMAQSVINRYGPDQMQWHYEHGLVLQSIFLTGQRTGNEEFCRYVQSMYDTKITRNGNIISYREDEFNLDQINPGKTLFLLYKKYGGEKYRLAIEKLREQLRIHPRTASGGFWHKRIYPWQMWLDGLYMQGPFYAQYASEFTVAEDAAAMDAIMAFDDIEHQFTLIESKARDNKTGLLYHAWDESRRQRWASPDTGCSPHFWGRALGWYCMALVDVLEFIPLSYPKNYAALAAIARRLIAPLLRYQDADSGLWYQILDRGDTAGNYTESSASSMFVYFLLKILRMGLVEEGRAEEVKAAAHRAYQGLLAHKVRVDPSGELHLTGICKVAGLGGNPYRDGSYEYYVNEPIATDDFKGVGPFILASLEME
jgi:unsaturated rhamnogalacturonyl hydrolase